MAKKSSNKKITNNEFDVGKRYAIQQVYQKEVFTPNNTTVGLKSTEILTGNDLEQMLGAYLDEQNVWTLNLNSTFYAINIPDDVCEEYTLTSNLHWPTISFNIYGTTRLAWLLMKLNGVKDRNIFDIIHSGQTIKYLDKTRYVNLILQALRENQ